VVTGQKQERLDAAGAARRILGAEDRGEALVSLLVLDGPAEGSRRIVAGTWSEGSTGIGSLDAALDDLGRRILARELSPGRRGRDAGTHFVSPATGDGDPAGEEVQVYVERYAPSAELVIVGAGHLAVPLTRVGDLLGYQVTVLDDRPDFAQADRFPQAARVTEVSFSDPFAGLTIRASTHVVLVTRGHRYDYECLRRLLRLPRPPSYIGMIGSRRRVRATFHQLLEEGFAVEELERIRAPVGLDLGGETPEEIAVEVAAELVMLRRGGSGRPLIEVEGVARRFFSGPSNEDKRDST
jgi:xanthine/CO dehydrogenase XdhC/CoxF family maturation factor